LGHHPTIAPPLRFVKISTLSISDVVHFENGPHPPLLLRKSAIYQLPPNEKWLARLRGLGLARMIARIACSSDRQLFRVLGRLPRDHLVNRHSRAIWKSPVFFLSTTT
jgi:hypothetical protein